MGHILGAPATMYASTPWLVASPQPLILPFFKYTNLLSSGGFSYRAYYQRRLHSRFRLSAEAEALRCGIFAVGSNTGRTPWQPLVQDLKWAVVWQAISLRS